MKKAISAFNKKKNSIMRRTDLKNGKQQQMSNGVIGWRRILKLFHGHEHTYPGTVCE